MADDQIPVPLVPTLPADPSVQATPGAPQKSPLEVLEEILGKKQAAADSASAAPVAPPVSAQIPEVPATPPPEVPDPRLAAIEQQEAAYKIRDDAAAQATLEQIKVATQDPTYQAVLEEEKTQQAQTDQQSAAQAGFEIKQLDHTKI